MSDPCLALYADVGCIKTYFDGCGWEVFQAETITAPPKLNLKLPLEARFQGSIQHCQSLELMLFDSLHHWRCLCNQIRTYDQIEELVEEANAFVLGEETIENGMAAHYSLRVEDVLHLKSDQKLVLTLLLVVFL